MTAVVAAERPYWLGVGFAALAASCFGAAPTLARLAYDDGSDAPTAVLLRFAIAWAMVSALQALRRRPLALPAPDRWQALAVGAIAFVMSSGYLAAVGRIPVGLAVLIFYAFPAIVAVAGHLLGRERLTGLRVAALVVAFLGIALVVGVHLHAHDPVGIAYAFVAACGCAATLILTAPLVRRRPPLAVNAHVLASATVIAAGALWLAGDGPAWPAQSIGWVGLIGASAIYGVGIMSVFLALGLLTPFKVAMLNNLEPPVAVVVAVLVLNEAVGPVQLAGLAAVLGALLLLHRQDSR